MAVSLQGKSTIYEAEFLSSEACSLSASNILAFYRTQILQALLFRILSHMIPGHILQTIVLKSTLIL
jgi:hypothetical protein